MTDCPPPILHIYGQGRPHDMVRIVGTWDALLALQTALIFAERGKPSTLRVMDRNGEHYDVEVISVSEAEIDAGPYPTPGALAMQEEDYD